MNRNQNTRRYHDMEIYYYMRYAYAKPLLQVVKRFSRTQYNQTRNYDRLNAFFSLHSHKESIGKHFVYDCYYYQVKSSLHCLNKAHQ